MSDKWYDNLGWDAASTWDSIMTIAKYVNSDEWDESHAVLLIPDLALLCIAFDEMIADKNLIPTE